MNISTHNIRLTAPEIGNLWLQYIIDSAAICMIRYFLDKTEDTQIQQVLQTALNMARSHVQEIDKIFRQEGFPVPMAFTEKDVNLGAPRLFSDPFHLNYIKNMAKSGMVAYGLSLSLFSRADVRQFAMECLKTTIDLDEQTTQVMQSKGLYVRPPYTMPQGHAEFIKETDYLGSFFGQQRALNCMEITHLFLNCQSNGIAKALIVGFSQVAHASDVRDLFLRGADIADKHVEVFNTSLKEAGLPGPMSLDSDIMASTVAPFSDKLMLLHVITLVNMGLGYYAAGIGASLRKDIILDYTRLSAEAIKYSLEGMRLLINHGWAEEPPLAVNRKELAFSR